MRTMPCRRPLSVGRGLNMSEDATKIAVKTAVVTGASAGFGAATAQALAGAGFHVFLGARRRDRLQGGPAPLEEPAPALPLDVPAPASVAAFAARLPERVHLLVNNAG